jgi:aryl-alcohol dehydrogenase-like predicted oxidoreductase
MFPTLNHFGVGIIPWSPLARGLLTRPLKTDAVTTRGNTDLCEPLTVILHAPSNICLTLLEIRDTLLSIWKERAREKLSTGLFFLAKWHDLCLTSSNRVEDISRKRGISMAQVSLAWSLTRVTAPVVGSTSIKNLEELISACNYYIFRVKSNY